MKKQKKAPPKKVHAKSKKVRFAPPNGNLKGSTKRHGAY